jgi:hypothetical protein
MKKTAENTVNPLRPAPPAGKTMKLITSWECLVNLCSGLGMTTIPNTPRLAAETGLKMRQIQLAQNKALEQSTQQLRTLYRQINYFSGRTIWQRIVGVFICPKYEQEGATLDDALRSVGDMLQSYPGGSSAEKQGVILAFNEIKRLQCTKGSF